MKQLHWILRAGDGTEQFRSEKLGHDMTAKNSELGTLHHAALRVKDVKAAVAWYTQRFKCEVEYQDATWAMLAFANVRLAFVLQEQHPPHIAVEGDPSMYGTPT